MLKITDLDYFGVDLILRSEFIVVGMVFVMKEREFIGNIYFTDDNAK